MDESWVTTSVLLEQLRNFEDSAWQLFEARFRRPLLRFARAAGLPAADAEDVTQETLLAFAESYRADRYQRDRGRLCNWLFRIARHKVVDSLRNQGRRARHEAPEAQHSSFWNKVPEEASREAAWDDIWEESLLAECTQRVQQEVSESTWRAFELTALQAQPAAQVAEQLNLSRNAVFLAKHRVIQRLRKLQQEYDAEEEPG